MNCDCIKKIDEHLKETGANACLDTLSMMNMETGKVRETVRIPLQRVDRTVKRWKKNMVPVYCPFCGTRAFKDEQP